MSTVLWMGGSLFLASLASPEDPAPDPPGSRPEVEVSKPAPPALKTPQAEEKFREGVQKLEAEEYAGARTILTACLKDASTPADRKAIQALIDDARLGLEIEAARKMAEQKNEKRAIARVEAALKANPQSPLAPKAEKFIRDTEEIIYCMLDDFEPGGTLHKETQGRDPARGETGEISLSSRFRSSMSFNSDPRYVFHGKGSLKWRAGGSTNPGPGPGGKRWRGDPEMRGYISAELRSPITNWRTLVFHVYLPEADEGSLQVTLAPTADARVQDSLYSLKNVDLRGKKGWLPVQLDLQKDFGNSRNLKLEDVRFIRIEYLQTRFRTFYLDFIHLE
jgi:hypothetical protein